MGNRNVVKILLDVVMTVLYLYLMFGFDTSLVFHEIAGMGLGLLFIAHIYLNYQPLKRLYNMVKKGKATPKNAFLFWSDLAFGVSMVIVMITGIMISRVVFSFTGNLLLIQIHDIASYAGLGILGIHLLLHLKYVIGMVKYLFTHLKNKQVRKALVSFGVAGVVFAITFSRVYTIYDAKNNLAIVSETEKDNSQITDENTASAGPEPNDKDTIEGDISETTPSQEGGTNNTPEEETLTETNAPTVEEYLGDLICTACPRRCPLLTPRCMKGERQKQNEIVKYEQEYAEGNS